MTQTPAQRLLAQVVEDERLAELATVGPWEHEYSPAGAGWFDQPEFCHVDGWTDNGDGDVLNLKIEDAEFIAASRTIVPTRAAQLRVLVEALEWYAEHHDKWIPPFPYEHECIATKALAAAARIGDGE